MIRYIYFGRGILAAWTERPMELGAEAFCSGAHPTEGSQWKRDCLSNTWRSHIDFWIIQGLWTPSVSKRGGSVIPVAVVNGREIPGLEIQEKYSLCIFNFISFSILCQDSIRAETALEAWLPHWLWVLKQRFFPWASPDVYPWVQSTNKQMTSLSWSLVHLLTHKIMEVMNSVKSLGILLEKNKL